MSTAVSELAQPCAAAPAGPDPSQVPDAAASDFHPVDFVRGPMPTRDPAVESAPATDFAPATVSTPVAVSAPATGSTPATDFAPVAVSAPATGSTSATESRSSNPAADAAATDRPSRSRIIGLDIARGIAIIGMFVVHMFPGEARNPITAAVEEACFGRSAILFAGLAGISLALLSGGRRPPRDARGRLSAMLAIAVRAIVIFGIGLLLTKLDTPVDIILTYYGLMFILALPLLWLGPRVLFILAGVWVVVGSLSQQYIARFVQSEEWFSGLIEGDPLHQFDGVGFASLLATGTYPAWSWLTYLMVGLAIGRLGLDHIKRWVLVVVGLGLAILGYGGSYVALRLAADLVPNEDTFNVIGAFLVIQPHSGTTFEMVGGIGVALVVLAACLGLAERAPRIVAPLAAIGAMPLTLYTAHILVFDQLTTGQDHLVHSVRVVVELVLVGMMFALVWLRLFRRGPLESIVHTIVSGVTGWRPRPIRLSSKAARRVAPAEASD